MVCDYYVRTYLEIEHIHGISYYELQHICCYFSNLDCGFYDSDDDFNDRYYKSKEYYKLYENMVQLCLTPRKDVVIYLNQPYDKCTKKFITKRMEEKYLPIIYDKINGIYMDKNCIYQDTGKITNITEIIKITKKEIRHITDNIPYSSLSNIDEKSDNIDEESYSVDEDEKSI
jgi:hypothetical protein